MNSIVALPIAAAIPTIAPALPPSVAPIEKPSDGELLAVAREYVAAEAEYSRLVQIHNDLEDHFLTAGKPEVLRVRPGDVDLGIRAFMGRLGENYSSIAVDFLRGERWPHPEIEVDAFRGEWVVDKWIDPTPEARQRADEIVDAFDLWQKTRKLKKPRKLTEAKRRQKKAGSAMMELEQRLAEMPATSIAGLIAKAQCAAAYQADCEPEADDPLAIFSASIVRDLLAISANAPVTASPAKSPAPDHPIESLAAMNFEPWTDGPGEWTPPSNKEWIDQFAGHLPTMRVAFALMHKSKPEYQQFIKNISNEAGEAVLDGFVRSANFLQLMLELVGGAEARFFSAAASLATAASDEGPA